MPGRVSETESGGQIGEQSRACQSLGWPATGCCCRVYQGQVRAHSAPGGRQIAQQVVGLRGSCSRWSQNAPDLGPLLAVFKFN